MTRTSFDALVEVLQVLQQLQIPHMLVGSFSCNAYAMPRSTKDADIVVQMRGRDLNSISDALSDDFFIDRQMSFETITNSVRNVLTFRPTKFDIELFRLGEDAHHLERFARKQTRSIPSVGVEATIPTAEDVIIQKLRWQREKDISDARNVLQTQFQKLDWTYLRRWTDEHQTTELLEQLRAEAEE